MLHLFPKAVVVPKAVDNETFVAKGGATTIQPGILGTLPAYSVSSLSSPSPIKWEKGNFSAKPSGN